MPVKSLEREKRNISIPNTDSTLSMLLLMVVTLVYSIKVSTTALTHTHKGSSKASTGALRKVFLPVKWDTAATKKAIIPKTPQIDKIK